VNLTAGRILAAVMTHGRLAAGSVRLSAFATLVTSAVGEMWLAVEDWLLGHAPCQKALVVERFGRFGLYIIFIGIGGAGRSGRKIWAM
jgi:hypothetical protein